MDKLARIAAQFAPPMEGAWLTSPLGDGHINDTYLVESQQVRFVLQRLNHLVFKDPWAVQKNFQLISDHLDGRGYPLKNLRPMAARDGQLLVEDGEGNFWRGLPFFEKTFSPAGRVEPSVAFEAARAVGVFLEKMSDFPAAGLAETIPGFHDTETRWAVFEKILRADPTGRVKGASAEADLLFEKNHLFERIFSMKKSGSLPTRVTHNDPKAANVLLDISTKKAVAVIDWDTVMPGTVPSDFGDMVRSFAPTLAEDDPNFEKMSLDLPVVEAMCRGFLAGADGFLTKEEREGLFAGGLWIVFEQALRFLTDHLSGDVYYKTGHAGHNLTRARNQLALLRAVERAEVAIRGFLRTG